MSSVSERLRLAREQAGLSQGQVAKLLGMHRAVNITLGLPIVRTSPAHGTAYDIAWQGRADCGGIIEALRVAAALTENERRASSGPARSGE